MSKPLNPGSPYQPGVGGSGGGGGGGSGGVIGTASFNPSSSAIVGLFVDGVIASVTYISTGRYQVTFGAAQPDTHYVVSVVGSDDDAAPNLAYLGGPASNYTTSGFVIQNVSSSTGTPRNPQVIRIAVMRTTGG